MILKPKGTYDVYGEDAKKYRFIESLINDYMSLMNAGFIRTPIFEASELIHRSVGDESDIVSKETYDFLDRKGRSLTLRPEATASVVRSLIENKLYANTADAIKYYYFGTMYRYERPQSGRNREFTQFGLEVFNCNTILSDVEVISCGYDILSALGIECTVYINCLGDSETRERYTTAIKEYLAPHIDELCDDCKARFLKNPLRILDCKVDAGSEIFKNMPVITDYLTDESKSKFEELKNFLIHMDVDFEIDTSIVRGLDYYNDFVYEYKASDGLALGGGGRYDTLVSKLGGPSINACGFALGIERLMMNMNTNIDEDIFDAYILAVSPEEKLQALKLVNMLRLSGFKVSMSLNDASLKSQFKYADKLNSKFLIILNDDDLKLGLINIKDNILKTEEKIDEYDILEYFFENL